MLILNNITLNIAGNILIKDSSVNIPTNSKIGFLGKNGSGKSSLFRAISGDIELQTGDIKFAKHATIGWVKQEVATGQESLLDILLSSDKERSSLLDELGNSVDATRIAEICEKLEEIDAYSAPARAQAILNGLGFSEEEHHGPIENFSGGMRMRVALAASLFSRPDILLLDEPSNYLDLEGVMWLEQYIKKFTGTIILISHDKNLLNNCANHILHLEHQKLTLWKGNYNSYLKLYAEKLNISQQQLKAQTEKIQRLERFIERFRYKASKARQAQSRVKTLEKIKQIEIYSPERTQAFSFLAREKTLASPLVKIENIFLGYDNKYILKNLNLPINNDDRIALLGKNGNGKSTFAKFLAQRLEPLKGEKVQHPKISIGYFEQHNIKALNLDLNAIEHIALIFPNLPEAKQRAMAANWGLSGEKALIKTRNLSGGQKTRLAMGLATAKEIDLLILDEPTNHLDLESREELIRALNNYNGAVLLISHDQYLLEATIDCLWHVENNTIAVFEGTLEDYKQNILQPKSAKKKVKKVGSIDLKKDINKIETKLAKLHKDLAELNEILYIDYSAKNQREKTKLEEEIEKLELYWLEYSQQYEKDKANHKHGDCITISKNN